MQTVTLNNGVVMPMLGYGVYQVDPAECARCVREAIEVGYRSIDTAQAYRNEEGVGAAVAASGVPREELFLTTKVWISNAGEAAAAASIEESLRKLATDYIDLLLIHQPFGDYYGAWRAMEALLAEGHVRAIGVSNFYPDRLVDLILHSEVTPQVNQIETHPFFQRADYQRLMADRGVQIEAWGPFAEGKNGLFTNPVLSGIAEAHGKSVGQVVLHWLTQRGVVVIPKTVRAERMAENIDVFDFELSDDEMAAIAILDTGASQFFDHRDPAMVKWLTGRRLDV